MRFPVLAAAALLAAAPALAQTRPQTSNSDPRADASQPASQVSDQLRPDPTGISASTVTPTDTADDVVLENPTLDDRSFQRLDRDVRALGNSPDAQRYGQQRDAIRRDYDALGATPTAEQRMGVMQRYTDLDMSVGMARMNMAPRADYLQMGETRLAGYDREIANARRGFDAATGTARADRARELIRMRRQRDMYHNEILSVRGVGRSGFEDARRAAAPNISRIDSEFWQTRRGAAPGTQPAGGSRN